MDDIVKRLARACARGNSQLGFVNELLADEGQRYLEQYGYQKFVRYGDSRLGGTSWASLKKRLLSVGFIIKVDQQTGQVTMRFSA